MSFEEEQTSLFDLEMDYEEVLEIPDDYLQVRLSELDNHQYFIGKPQISGIIKAEYDDGFDENGNEKTKVVHKLRLIIVNDEEMEYLDINLNLKSNSYQVETVRKGSVLFDFIQSILEIENTGCTKGKNIFRNINLKQFTDFINNNVEKIKIENIERNGNFKFNSFRIVQINNMKLK